MTDTSEDSSPPPDRFPGDHRPGVLRAVTWGITAAGVLAALIVGGSWRIGGRGLADRTLTDFAMPLGMLWTLLLITTVAAVVRRQWSFAAFSLLIWILLGLAGSRPLGGMVQETVRYTVRSDPADQIDAPLDAVVLLGGYAWPNQFDVPELASDGQRLMLTAQLWHAGKTKTIICTGTAHYGTHHPSKLGKQLLTSIGVPEQAIFEVPGENTLGEMRGLNAFFDAPPQAWLDQIAAATDVRELASSSTGVRSDTGPRSIGLVTSADHMPRAVRLAKSQQLELIALPCSLSGSAEEGFNPRDLIPAAGGAASLASGLKESLARWVGR